LPGSPDERWTDRCKGFHGRWAHPIKVDSLGGHFVHVGRLVAEVLLEAGKAGGTERRIVPQEVDDIRRLPVLLLQFGQFLVEFFILSCLFLSVMGFEDVILGVVNNRVGGQHRQSAKDPPTIRWKGLLAGNRRT
jgi:hypothetical protein